MSLGKKLHVQETRLAALRHLSWDHEINNREIVRRLECIREAKEAIEKHEKVIENLVFETDHVDELIEQTKERIAVLKRQMNRERIEALKEQYFLLVDLLEELEKDLG
jgi:hypothetical protein